MDCTCRNLEQTAYKYTTKWQYIYYAVLQIWLKLYLKIAYYGTSAPYTRINPTSKDSALLSSRKVLVLIKDQFSSPCPVLVLESQVLDKIKNVKIHLCRS